jgi:hypothetical protein
MMFHWMRSKLADWVRGFPWSNVGDDRNGGPIFTRYKLLKCRWFGVYVHEFFRDDRERCLHDHPWWFVSIVLRGGYWEETASGYRWKRPGSVLVRRAKFAHRIDVDPARPLPWSLVIVGPKHRDWGFYTRTGWVKWRPGLSQYCE